MRLGTPHPARTGVRDLVIVRGKEIGSERVETAVSSVDLIVACERVLTVSEIVENLKIDRHVVMRLFAHERGVICIGNRETQRGKRKYRTLRIPVSVFNRVVARLSNK